MIRQTRQSQTARQVWRLFDPVTTVGATTQTAASVLLPEDRAIVMLFTVLAHKSDFSAAGSYDVLASFRRQAGGNIIASSGPSGNQRIVGDFPNPQPVVTLVANTSTQSAELHVTGKTGLTIKWLVQVETFRNL